MQRGADGPKLDLCMPDSLWCTWQNITRTSSGACGSLHHPVAEQHLTAAMPLTHAAALQEYTTQQITDQLGVRTPTQRPGQVGYSLAWMDTMGVGGVGAGVVGGGGHQGEPPPRTTFIRRCWSMIMHCYAHTQGCRLPFRPQAPQAPLGPVRKFLMPMGEAEFALTTALEELQRDAYPVPSSLRPARCTGTALQVRARLVHSAPCAFLSVFCACVGVWG